MSETALRSSKLRKRLKEVLSGSSQLRTPREAQLFIEALTEIEDSAQCAEQLVASRHGLEALRVSVRLDISQTFIQGHAIKLIGIIVDAAVERLAGGLVRTKLLVALLDPPTFWTALLEVLLAQNIDVQYHESVAQLLYAMTCSPEFNGEIFTAGVQKVMDTGVLQESTVAAVRDTARKIHHAVAVRQGTAQEDQNFPSGGRHDNDFANFREVAIYPTPDELSTTTRPFLRQADAVFTTHGPIRVEVHIDNQFRLLREDMLGEIRSEMQICLGQKKGRRSALILGPLRIMAIELGDEKRSRKPVLTMTCEGGIPQLRGLDAAKRKKYLEQHYRFMKHNSFGALLHGNDVCGFASLERDEAAICKDILHLRFDDTASLSRALKAFKAEAAMRFVFVDAPVFAYQPVLEQLKQLTGSSLVEFLLTGDQPSLSRCEAVVASPGVHQLSLDLLGIGASSSALQRMGIEVDSLDQCQTAAIARAISQEVTLIYGPPGKSRRHFWQ